jgi:hypothetical protein
VQTFWETFNNFPLGSLMLRDSVHLFKKTVKPVWEDRRNVRGGSWTFRVPKQDSAEVWKNIQLMAIGEVLQDAVEPGKAGRRTCFLFSLFFPLSLAFTSLPPHLPLQFCFRSTVIFAFP